MTQRLVALLRGINVGKAKRVPMAELRAAVEALGFTQVETLLNSGNVVFSGPRRVSASVADDIRGEVERRTGVDARVTVIAGKAFGEIVEANPLHAHASDPARALIAFLREPRAARDLLHSLAGQTWEPELLAVGESAAYLWCPRGISAGALALAVDKALGDQVTMRNLATAMKIQARL